MYSTGASPRPGPMRTSHSNGEIQILLSSIRTRVTRPSAAIVGAYHSFLWVVKSCPRRCFRDSLTTSLSQCCLNRSVDLGRIGALPTWFSQPGSFRKSAGSNIRTCLWPFLIFLKHSTLCKESSYGTYSSGLAVSINVLTSSASSMM